MLNTNSDFSDHDAFLDIFGNSPADLHLLPNLVTLTGSLPLESMLKISHTAGAILFDSPPYNEDGLANSGVGSAIEQFRLWRTPLNQSELIKRGAHFKLGCFTAVLDSELPHTTLHSILASCSVNDAPYIDDLLPSLIDQIEVLGWCYIPLSDEYPLALILVRPTRSSWIDRMRSTLQSAGSPHTDIRKENSTISWSLPCELRSACDLQTGD